MDILLTSEEVALKLKVSYTTLRRYVKSRKISAIKLPGGDLRFKQEHVENWLDSRTIKARA